MLSTFVLHVSSMCLPSHPKQAKVEVVSHQQPDEEAPEELSSYHKEGGLHLEQTDCLREPQALDNHKVQTPEAINGGSHQGVCGSVCCSGNIYTFPFESTCLSATDCACTSRAL